MLGGLQGENEIDRTIERRHKEGTGTEEETAKQRDREEQKDKQRQGEKEIDRTVESKGQRRNRLAER